MNIQGKIDRFNRVVDNINGVPALIEWLVSNNQAVILELNKDQMLLGRNALGQVLTPSYLDDPYFKSQAEALSYKNMKEKLEADHRHRITHPLNYGKDSNTPNLIVKGNFQDAMFLQVSGSSFTIGSTYEDANDIEKKYNNAVFGLAPLSREYFYLNYMLRTIIKHIYR